MRQHRALRTAIATAALLMVAAAAQAKSFAWKVTGKSGVV